MDGKELISYVEKMLGKNSQGCRIRGAQEIPQITVRKTVTLLNWIDEVQKAEVQLE